MSKVLVTYFSATGTTARAAKAVAEELGADLREIAPAQPYTAADLNWNNKASRSTVEMNDAGARPELAAELARLAPEATWQNGEVLRGERAARSWARGLGL